MYIKDEVLTKERLKMGEKWPTCFSLHDGVAKAGLRLRSMPPPLEGPDLFADPCPFNTFKLPGTAIPHI